MPSNVPGVYIANRTGLSAEEAEAAANAAAMDIHNMSGGYRPGASATTHGTGGSPKGSSKSRCVTH